MKNPIVPIFAVLLAVFVLWFGFSSGPYDFEGNLLPELIGFCLEGIFSSGSSPGCRNARIGSANRNCDKALQAA